MSSRSRLIPGYFHRGSIAAAVLLIATAGCNYGFTGGGLPSNLRSIYIENFENDTPYLELTSELATTLQRLPGALGIRLAGRDAADLVLRGRITRYDDAASNYRPTNDGRSEVLSQQVQIGISVELLDVRNNQILWEGRGLSGSGQYRAEQGTTIGRRRALEELVQRIIDGAQSQW